MVDWVEQVQAVESDQSAANQTETQTCSVELQSTYTPVWPEDELREDAQRAVDRLPPIKPAPSEDVPKILTMIDLRLPEVLTVYEASGAAAGRRRVEVEVPVTFLQASRAVMARRLALALHIQAGAEDAVAVVYELWPPSKVVESVKPVKVGLEAKAMDVATAKVETSLDVKSVIPVVQAGGVNTSDCRWIVADQELISDFRPKVYIDAPEHGGLRIEARLHIELHRYWLKGIIHRVYGISRSPHAYAPMSSFLKAASAPDFIMMRRVDPHNEDLKHDAQFETLPEFISPHCEDLKREVQSATLSECISHTTTTATTATRMAPDGRRSRRTLTWGIAVLFVVIVTLSIIFSIV